MNKTLKNILIGFGIGAVVVGTPSTIGWINSNNQRNYHEEWAAEQIESAKGEDDAYIEILENDLRKTDSLFASYRMETLMDTARTEFAKIKNFNSERIADGSINNDELGCGETALYAEMALSKIEQISNDFNVPLPKGFERLWVDVHSYEAIMWEQYWGNKDIAQEERELAAKYQ